MDLSKKRCGECGEKAYKMQKIEGQWKKPWKDFPSVFLTKTLELWVCGECSVHAVTPKDSEKIDAAIEASIRSQVSQFLDIINAKSGLKFEAIAVRLGYSPSYISSLKNEKTTPAFKLWNQLKSISINPKREMEQLDPDFDIIANNILLRA